MAFPYLIQGANIVVVIGNKAHTVSKTHITYNKVLEAIKADDWDAVAEFIEPAVVVMNYGAGNVTITGETLFWKGTPLNSYLATKMILMLQEGFPVEPMALFMENLMKNPSKRAVDELYPFLEKGQLPITPDGHFLAYKKIRKDGTDVHSGTMDNSVGMVVEMERNTVDDDKNRTCSAGLHFCSKDYLGNFGGDRVMILKINPADVVSIPSDYNDSKGRACRYEVIGELDQETVKSPEKAFTAPVQPNGHGTAQGGFWPFPNEVDPAPVVKRGPVVPATTAATNQDYDKWGNALSMTKDAIRKRKARAAKAYNASASMLRGWPTPKGF
jgi:hypothetical protein